MSDSNGRGFYPLDYKTSAIDHYAKTALFGAGYRFRTDVNYAPPVWKTGALPTELIPLNYKVLKILIYLKNYDEHLKALKIKHL